VPLTPPSTPSSRRAPSPLPGPSKPPRSLWVAAAITFAMMLLVPLGLLTLGRSLVPKFDRFGTFFATPAVSSSAAPEPVVVDPDGARLRVKVMDSDGNLIAGAAVHLVPAKGAGDVVADAKTNARGVCSFKKELLIDGMRVVASHDPQGIATSPALHAMTDDAGSTDVELVLSAADAITGTVVAGSGGDVVVLHESSPVAGAILAIDEMPWALDGVASAVTGADGSFRLTTVPHEARTLLVSARGYRSARVSLAERASSTELTLHVTLVPGPPIEGDVTDEAGNPVSAHITACEGEPFEAEGQSTREGSFTMPSSTLGCTIVATNDAFGASEGVTAVEGRRLALRLKPGGAIEGAVVDERGVGIPSFSIGIESFSASRGQGRRSSRRRNIEDARGSFHWDKLAPGTYILTASAPGKPPTRSEPVDVTAGVTTSGVRITVAAGGIVLGHVYDDKHAPVGGASISFDQVSSTVPSSAHADTDDKGAYRIEGAPAGPFTLRVEKQSFRLRFVAGLSVASGASLTEDVTLSAANEAGSMELGGIGATLDQSREGVVLRGVFPGDPADKAGLKAGDLVQRIDGESTESMSLADVLQRLRGEAGTTVGISVKRKNEETPGGATQTISVIVVRAVVVH